jgi:hypothetical protein
MKSLPQRLLRHSYGSELDVVASPVLSVRDSARVAKM